MTIHIDKIDTEIEIISADDGAKQGRAVPGSSAPTPAPRGELRRAIARSLEEELYEYLRIRG